MIELLSLIVGQEFLFTMIPNLEQKEIVHAIVALSCLGLLSAENKGQAQALLGVAHIGKSRLKLAMKADTQFID